MGQNMTTMWGVVTDPDDGAVYIATVHPTARPPDEEWLMSAGKYRLYLEVPNKAFKIPPGFGATSPPAQTGIDTLGSIKPYK